ncbi:MAG: hypothetical protein ACWGKN_01285 [Desulfoprunum sp.]|jgi:hypothetical protein
MNTPLGDLLLLEMHGNPVTRRHDRRPVFPWQSNNEIVLEDTWLMKQIAHIES